MPSTLLDPSDEEVWLAVILIFPNRGSSKPDEGRKVCQQLFETLDSDLIATFRKVFNNNNRDLVSKFLTNSLTRKLWNVLIHEMPGIKINPKILRTYKVIAQLLSEVFELSSPAWLS